MTVMAQHAAPTSRPNPDTILVERLIEHYASTLCQYSVLRLCPLHLKQARERVLMILDLAERAGYVFHKVRFAPGESIDDFYEAAGVPAREEAQDGSEVQGPDASPARHQESASEDA